MKLSKLEAFVWANQDRDWHQLASETNRSFSEIARAYTRAKTKTFARHASEIATIHNGGTQ